MLDAGFNGAKAFSPWMTIDCEGGEVAAFALQWGQGVFARDDSLGGQSIQLELTRFNGAKAFSPWMTSAGLAPLR